MNEIFDIYTLIFLVAAVVIFIRLRNVLGSKTGNERRWGQFPTQEHTEGAEKASDGGETRNDNVIPLPGTTPETFDQAAMTQTDEDLEEVLDKFAPAGSSLRAALMQIIERDPSFNPEGFIAGAKIAYEMILMGFAAGNKKLLKQYLSSDVFEGFMGAVKDRESRGETVDSNFVGIEKADIVGAEMRDKTAHVTVRFVGSLISATHNKDGDVVDGDPKKVRRVTDVWTFARKVTSRDPNWTLVATESAH